MLQAHYADERCYITLTFLATWIGKNAAQKNKKYLKIYFDNLEISIKSLSI